jgi:hypothetical protein
MSTLTQSGIGITNGEKYQMSFVDDLAQGSFQVLQGTQIIYDSTSPVAMPFVFTANASGDSISFVIVDPQTVVSIDQVHVKHYTDPWITDIYPVKEFLSGQLDENDEIFFRADTQIMQVQNGPEMHSNVIAVLTETERGSEVKAFVSIDEAPFYQLEGTVTKGISILKPNSSSDYSGKPPLVKTIQMSYRDSSKNLCRILQAAIITSPTTIDYSQ